MLIKILNKSHTKAYRSLPLRSFRESPLAFSESYEDEKKKTVAAFAAELAKTNDSFALGAFSSTQEMIGFVPIKKDTRSKALHKSMIHAMYVAPEARGKNVGKRLMEHLLKKVKKIAGLEQIHL